jgi:hypothetical protein
LQKDADAESRLRQKMNVNRGTCGPSRSSPQPEFASRQNGESLTSMSWTAFAATQETVSCELFFFYSEFLTGQQRV